MAIIKDLYDNKWISLYEENNIHLYSRFATYKSTITGQEYDIITGITILKDNEVIYQRKGIHMAYSTDGLISISNYVEKIVCYIVNTNDDKYWIDIFLDKLFIKYNTMDIEIYYKKKTRELKEKKEQEKSKNRRKTVEHLQKEVQKLYNNKGYAVAYGTFDIFVIDKKHSTKDTIKNQDDFYNMFYEENSRDDKSQTREQFLFRHIELKEYNSINTIKQLKNIVKELKEAI